MIMTAVPSLNVDGELQNEITIIIELQKTKTASPMSMVIALVVETSAKKLCKD